MFSSDLDRHHYPLSSRSRGIILGSIKTIAVAAALVSARTVPFLFAAAVASFLIAAALRGQLESAVPRRGPVFWHLAIFLLYAAMSSAWAEEPQGTLMQILSAMLVAAGSLAMSQMLDDETRPNLLHMGEGLWTGFMVGLIYLLVEIASDQSIKVALYNALGFRPGELPHPEYFVWSGSRLVSISREDLTRNMAPLTLYFWPVILAIMGTLRRPVSTLVAIVATVLAVVVVMLAWHETSKLALLAGLLAFGCGRLALRVTGRMVAIGWVVACLAVLPTALIATRLGVQEASWLQFSARHRIVIWGYTAEQVLKAPWLGVGARSTYVLAPHLKQQKPSDVPVEPVAPTLVPTLSVHSHSVYLQTWFELGLIGATLLTLLGLAMLQAIGSLARSLQPYAYATFVAAAVTAASSYGMWQIWFVAMFGFCATLFSLSASLALKRDNGVKV